MEPTISPVGQLIHLNVALDTLLFFLPTSHPSLSSVCVTAMVPLRSSLSSSLPRSRSTPPASSLSRPLHLCPKFSLSPSISHSALSSQNERDSNHVSLWCHTLQWLETTLGTCPNSLLSWISWPYTMGSLPKPHGCCFSQSLCYITLAFSRFQKVPCFVRGLFRSP